MGRQTQIIIVAIQLRGVSAAGNVLIHRLELEVAVAVNLLPLCEPHMQPIGLSGQVEAMMQQCSPTGSRIDGEVESHFPESLARKAKHGIGDGEARIGYVVLIVGLVEALVVVPVQLQAGLHQHIGF